MKHVAVIEVELYADDENAVRDALAPVIRWTHRINGVVEAKVTKVRQ